MPRTIKFHLDEMVEGAVALGLRRRGVDISTTADAGLGGAADEDQLNHCVAMERVIFTMDQDFLRLHATRPDHKGIVFAHQQRTSIGDAIRGLLLIWELLDPQEMHGRLEYL
jgi:hypothetical protein